ncbi:protein BEAN1 [Salarias fasciatus]|uniref:protein BEAN1 n=1 Tax=Salarias fasciatus TaxID=181472 RepID=UPI001176F76A|nr:protein BEAN1 [Salarias fasciatus]
MLMKLICSVSSNQSHGEYPDCRSERESGGEASLLVSPLVVAGIVIGLVLFLSCITIIVGSLRKDSRLRNPHLRASYGPDGFSYGGSAGDLRSSCLEDFPPGLDFDSYRETLPPINSLYPDSPPRYDECVGPGSTQIYIPTDDPPPYSLLDPCRAEQEARPGHAPPGASAGAARFSPSHQPPGLPEQEGRGVASISFPVEAAPPYEAVLAEQGQPLPLMPCDLDKHQSQQGDDGRSQPSPADQILLDS